MVHGIGVENFKIISYTQNVAAASSDVRLMENAVYTVHSKMKLRGYIARDKSL